MMIRFAKILSVFFCTALLLSACQTGGGYGSRSVWGQTTQRVPDINPPPATETTAPTETFVHDASAAQAIPSRENAAPIKVGLLLPLSGAQASLGQSLLDAAQLALFNIAGTSFELVPHDTQGTAAGAQNAAETVLQDGAQIILGPVFADAVRAVKPVAARKRVNIIAFSTDWSLAGGNTFLMGFMPFDQIERVIDYAARHNIQRVGILTPETDYGRIVSSVYRESAAQRGIRTTANASFSPDNYYLDPVIQSFVGTAAPVYGAASTTAHPKPFDAVLLPVGGNVAVTMANLLSKYGAGPETVRRIGTGLMDDSALFTQPGLNGTWFAAPAPNLREKFEREFKATYRYTPPRIATLAYDATALAAVLAQRGLQKSGSPAFDKNSIANPNGFAGIDGIFRFRSNGTAERGLAVLEIRNGSAQIIENAPQSFKK